MSTVHQTRLIRVAILRHAARIPCTTGTLTRAVRDELGLQVSLRSIALMAARLHRAGWLEWERWNGVERHCITVRGSEALHLLGGDA